MSYLVAAPEFLASAATDVSNIGSSLNAAHAAAAAPTTALAAAAGDEVSAAVAPVFAGYGQTFQGLSAQAAAFHEQLVQGLNSGAVSYASTEAANASPLQNVAASPAALGGWFPAGGPRLSGGPIELQFGKFVAAIEQDAAIVVADIEGL